MSFSSDFYIPCDLSDDDIPFTLPDPEKEEVLEDFDTPPEAQTPTIFESIEDEEAFYQHLSFYRTLCLKLTYEDGIIPEGYFID